MIEVNSFAGLKITGSSAAGELAVLRRYYANSYGGGDNFIGYIISSPPAPNGGNLAVKEVFYRCGKENYGISLHGSFHPGWYYDHRVTNNSGVDKWFNIGKINFLKDNLQWVFEITARRSREELDRTLTSGAGTSDACVTWLNVSRCRNGIQGNIQHKGLPSVLDVKLNRTGTIYAEVFIKVKANSGDTAISLRAAAPGRSEPSERCLFSPKMTEVADNPFSGTTAVKARTGPGTAWEPVKKGA